MKRVYATPTAETLELFAENRILSGGTENVTSSGTILTDDDFE